jgi:hypothetical protein
MSSATLVSVQEYLAASFDPDRDYVDGELEERNFGERPHSYTQMSLGAFSSTEKRNGEFTCSPSSGCR